ncbi:MAG: ATP-binding cassette domain-containing protein [Nitrospinaceae bacterium]|nr:ABC transporter ATP-binding protein [Nitrospinaceae bacterium]NIR55835.1 ABC transporter ATP-binding protein [Nitrospinaceae bacterium]NIS86288.1 ABC transporter ATP-binding protein [Nitrospinaceae bacterium]NIT83117.1 ABC transporter ATP-binding protein [Nitrospinaceae bacterium]NIU45327.1 ABC transporter ATP-binding protein [Nitrospinaceae bacterium]
MTTELKTSPTATLITVKGLTFAYETTPVIENISLDIADGAFTGVIGPNGSGKSTLLKLMGGILPAPPGTVMFRDRELSRYKKRELAAAVTWIPQEKQMAFPFKVIDIVLMGRHPYLSPLSFEGAEDYRIAEEAMRQTRVLEFAGRSFNEISGGEKQRVMIASAIAQKTDMMLLDEPTSALDIKYQIEILNILKQLNTRENKSLVLAMHDLHLASKYCQRLILLKKGRIFCAGPPREVLRKEILEEVYEVKVKLFEDDTDGSLLVVPEQS